MTSTTPMPNATLPPAITQAARVATLAFFTNSCQLPPTEQSVATPLTGPAVMGVISFFGDPVWSYALVMPESTSVAAADRFTGMDIPFDSPDMGDLVGEMANVMAGDIVVALEKAGMKAQMSLPTVARGHDVELLPPSKATEMRLHFTTPAGGFQVRLFQAVMGAPAGYRPGE